MSPASHIPKPKLGEACNGCGHCCTAQPCLLAQEFLGCMQGPCVALESRDGKNTCGLVRNPLGYLFKAGNPATQGPSLQEPPSIEASHRLSTEFAGALGLGMGCDADDDNATIAWNFRTSPHQRSRGIADQDQPSTWTGD